LDFTGIECQGKEGKERQRGGGAASLEEFLCFYFGPKILKSEVSSSQHFCLLPPDVFPAKTQKMEAISKITDENFG